VCIFEDEIDYLRLKGSLLATLLATLLASAVVVKKSSR
jgi:hypothetical protein